MNLLFANDKLGAYPPSWYAATADIPETRPHLQGDTRADICIVGAGYTGLSAALHLAQAGRRVVVLEAQRVGFGASGRNGGQLGTGQRVEQPYLEKMLGQSDARKLWELGLDATDLVRSLIETHAIECFYKPGVAWTAESTQDVTDLHAYAEHMDRHYEHPLEVLDSEAFHEICPSPAYCGGVIDSKSGHLHPLRFAIGLAQAAETAGATIHECSTVKQIEESAQVTVKTDTGTVIADHVILACNGYLGGLNSRVAARVMPINNFVAATAPLDDPARVLARDIAVADARFVVNYFRLSHDNRLLFGGGESYGYRFPRDIAAKVRKPMVEIFPDLANVPIDYAWGGTLAITMRRLPYLARLGPNILNASGYSGHGLGTATHAGMLMAQAIQGQSDGFDAMSAIPTLPFPGGARLRSPLLVLAMTWYSLRDRLGI